jgi:hypothetical protein
LHSANAKRPSVESRDPLSNVTPERVLQTEKQLDESVAIDEGIQIDRSDEENQKAHGPRIEMVQPGSKAKIETFPKLLNQDWVNVLIDEGTQSDGRENLEYDESLRERIEYARAQP